MTVVAIGSLKASPGVTTAMLALAAVWPASRPLLLVEADPDGGALAARFGLSTDPGLATAAPGLRREADDVVLNRHTQTLPGGTPLLVGPASPDQARASLAGCAARLGGALAASRTRDAIVDCGRLSIGTPVAPLLTAADTLLVVARPRLDELAHLTHRLPALAKASRRVGLVLIGEVPYRPDEVNEAVGGGLAFIARLANDPRAAAALNGDGAGTRRLAQSGLIRTARAVVDQITAAADVPLWAAEPRPAPVA